MADKIGELYVEIDANTKKFDTGIDAAKKGTEKFNTGLTSLSGTVKKLLGAGALIALATKVAAVGKASIDAASDAQETQNKFDVVFSGISGYANTMAESLATSYGTSIQGAKDMLAGTGDLLTGLGFTQASAFDLSEQVLTLGADLASFTNYSGGAEGASEALTKALLGEREMLKGLGISINEADVKAEMLRQTEQGLTFDTEKQAKAQATLTLAMSQTANAQGDFARSSTSMANQTKIAKAAVDDLQVQLGRALLPTATQGVSVFATLTQNIVEHITALNDARDVYDAFKNGTETVNDKLFVVKKQIAENSVEIDKLEDMYDRATDPKFKQKWKDQLVVLYEQNQVARRIESSIRQEIKAKQDLIDAEAEEQRLLEEKKKKEEDAHNARMQAYQDQNTAVQQVLENDKSEIDRIDAKIAEITKLSLADSQYRDDQQEALRILQEEKQTILDEEAEAKREHLAELQGDEDAFLEEQEQGATELYDFKAMLRDTEISDYSNFVNQLISLTNTLRDAQIADLEQVAEAKINALNEETLQEQELSDFKKKLSEENLAQDIADTEAEIANLRLLGDADSLQKAESLQRTLDNEAEERRLNELAVESREARADEIERIEKDLALEKYEIELAQFKAEKAQSVISAGIATALGITKSYPNLILAGIVAAAGATQITSILSQPDPPRPQLATGAIIPGSQRGVDVTVGESGNDELILGGGAKGENILNRFADKINARGGGGTVIVNLNGNGFFSRQDLDNFAEKIYPSTVKAQQRRGIQ